MTIQDIIVNINNFNIDNAEKTFSLEDVDGNPDATRIKLSFILESDNPDQAQNIVIAALRTLGLPANHILSEKIDNKYKVYGQWTLRGICPSVAKSFLLSSSIDMNGSTLVSVTNPFPTVSRRKKVYGKSAFSQMKEAFDLIRPSLNDEDIDNLQDKNYCRLHMSLAYPLLKKYDSTREIKEQVYMNKGNRYNKKIETINGEEFFLTNHLIHSTIDKVVSFLLTLKK